MQDRYANDVLAQHAADRARKPPEVELERDLVLEDPASGFCGAVVAWENGLVVLEDRHRRRRSYPVGSGLLLEGRPVVTRVPRRAVPARATHTASGSRVGPREPAKVAAASRILVEGRHDAELVEKIWGDDLRHVGVVVEHLGGIDDLAAVVDRFQPTGSRRLGVLVDHLVPGSKESRIVERVTSGPYGPYVLVAGHRHVDIWQAVRPEVLGIPAWPRVPKGTDWKTGTCRALGWPHATQADIALVWRSILAKVTSWRDLDRDLVTDVERLVDFVMEAEGQDVT